MFERFCVGKQIVTVLLGRRTWRKHGANPLPLAGEAWAWDARVAPTSLARLEDGFLLAYDGANVDPLASGGCPNLPGARCERTAVGGATSPDLLSWTKLPANPLLPPSTTPASNFDALRASRAACVADGDGVACAYAGASAAGAAAGVKVFSGADLAGLRKPLF